MKNQYQRKLNAALEVGLKHCHLPDNRKRLSCQNISFMIIFESGLITKKQKPTFKQDHQKPTQL